MRSEDQSTSGFVLCIASGLAGLSLSVFSLIVLSNQRQNGFNLLDCLVGLIIGTPAALLLWFALRGQFADTQARIAYAWMGGLILGGIGFAAGFIGPMIFMPGANQGPLLGIFITGPMGFVFGVVFGTIVGFRAAKRNAVDESPEFHKPP